jgi:hypothetical protein
MDAFATVADGLDAVIPGGTVHVHPGTYLEKHLFIGKSVTVASVSGDWHDTIIDPPATVFYINAGLIGEVTISGLTLTGSDYGIYVGGDMASDSTINVSNCLIYGNNDTGIYGSGLLAGDLVIDDCIVADNGGSTTGIHLTAVSGTVEITDSVIGAYWDGTTAYEGNAGGGIAIDTILETGSVLIDNNKVVGNDGIGIEDGYGYGCYGELTITNNIVGAYDYDLTSGDGYFDGNEATGIYIAHVDNSGIVTIAGNRIAGNGKDGVLFGGKTILGEVLIDDNYIGAWTDYTTDGGTLYTRTYTGNDDYGIASYSVAEGGSLVIINNRIAENGFSGTDFSGIFIEYNFGDVVVSSNLVGAWTQVIPGGDPVAHQGNGGTGIYVQDTVDGSSLLIIGNTIAENTALLSGIHIEAAGETADVAVHLNNLLNNSGSGVYYNYQGAGYLAEINAENNWWGAVSGPGGEGPGTGEEVGPNVDYEPWLEVSIANALAGSLCDCTLDAAAANSTEVVVDGSTVVTSANYSANPADNGFDGNVGKYIDVHVNDPSAVTEIEIRLYYTDDDIAGLDESSLIMRWWDGTAWVDCSDSGVTYPAGGPDYDGYIWARVGAATTPNLTQLSGTVFGSQGEEVVTQDTTDEGTNPSSGPPPQISGVALCSGGVAETTASICWTTDEKSTSQVKYWADFVTHVATDKTMVTEHNIVLAGLKPCTTYHYQTMSRNSDGKLAVSPEEYTFTTLGEVALAIGDLSISPGAVYAGETVSISAVVTNDGTCPARYEVTLAINGATESVETVTVAGGDSEEIVFTMAQSAAGSYAVDVNGLTGSFNVTASEENITPPGTDLVAPPTDENASSANWPMIGGIIAGVAVAVVFGVRRVRRQA